MLLAQRQRVAHLGQSVVAIVDALDLRARASDVIHLGYIDRHAEAEHRRRDVAANVLFCRNTDLCDALCGHPLRGSLVPIRSGSLRTCEACVVHL